VVLQVDPAAAGPPVFIVRADSDIRDFFRELDAGALDDSVEAALGCSGRGRLRRAPRPPRGIRIGVEHEFVVHREHSFDFSSIVDGLDLGIKGDPTDHHAQRGPWGGVITADGREAEVATPPVTLGPGAVSDAVALASLGRTTLERALGEDHWLEGYSTHLNVSAPPRGEVRRATLFASVFAPSLMLLLDRASSPGLLVRPRPGRLELGGDFAEGEALRVALTFAIGGVLAVGGREAREVRRLRVKVDLEPALERFGWYVDRSSFGCDLYELGRDAPLSLVPSNVTVPAGIHLQQTWEVARDHLSGVVEEDELRCVDAVVSGGFPLPRCQDGVASYR
jgi:hypothetical protein